LFLSCNSRGIIDDEGKRATNISSNDNILVFDEETFNQNKQLWQEQDFNNYSFHLALYSHTGNRNFWKGSIAVKNGELFGYISDFSMRYSMRPEEPKIYLKKWVSTISDIYENILANSQFHKNDVGREYTLELEYDNLLHFPKSYRFKNTFATPSVEFLLGGEGGRSFIISNFTLDPPVDNNMLTFDKETFDKKRQMWEELDLENYTFDLKYDSFEVAVWGQEPVWRNKWEGTVKVYSNVEGYSEFRFGPKDGILNKFLPRESGVVSIWLGFISTIYDRIDIDSQKNYGIAWNTVSKSILEIEYDAE
jgi:hypothetical protein